MHVDAGKRLSDRNMKSKYQKPVYFFPHGNVPASITQRAGDSEAFRKYAETPGGD